MEGMDVRGRVVADGAMFRLEITTVKMESGGIKRTTHVEEKKFFSKAEAKMFARASYGLSVDHIK